MRCRSGDWSGAGGKELGGCGGHTTGGATTGGAFGGAAIGCREATGLATIGDESRAEKEDGSFILLACLGDEKWTAAIQNLAVSLAINNNFFDPVFVVRRLLSRHALSLEACFSVLEARAVRNLIPNRRGCFVVTTELEANHWRQIQRVALLTVIAPLAMTDAAAKSRNRLKERPN